MKKKMLLAALLAAAMLLLCACQAATAYDYANREKYTSGGASITAELKNLEIDWVEGGVTVAYAKTNEITIAETARRALKENEKLCWWLDGDTLRIRYAQAGEWRFENLNKQLTVTLPEGTALKKADISAVSADICARPFYAETMNFSAVSGRINIECAASALTASSTSGDITLSAAANEITLNSTSGKIDAAVEHAVRLKMDTISGKLQAQLGEVKQAELNATSGNIIAAAKKPVDDLKIGTVSGPVNLTWPQSADVSAQLSTVSGQVSAPAWGRDGSRYTYGSGAAKVNISTVSGNITVIEGQE